LTDDLMVHLDDANFDSMVKSTPKMIVDCWAAWCGPCRMLAPTFEALAVDYKGKITFAKLDTDKSPNTAMALSIHSIPTLLFFKDGKQVQSLIGVRPKADIDTVIKKVFG
jgi:thioredoxin 1